MLEDLTKDELVALVRNLERNGESLKNRVDDLEATNRIMLLQLQGMSAQKAQWDGDKENQSAIIQRHMASKNEEIQILNETIADLRERLKAKE